MSRSVRKTPFCGCLGTSYSEKRAKQEWHQKMRSKSRIILRYADADTVLLPEMREVSDVWCMPNEGKLRFDPVERPDLMRK